MPLADIEATIDKAVTNIGKLGKAETDNKSKNALMTGAFGIEREISSLKKRQADLNKRIADMKSLDVDIKSYKQDVGDIVKKCTALLKIVKDCQPDTKGRDYFKIGNALDSFSGAAALDGDRS